MKNKRLAVSVTLLTTCLLRANLALGQSDIAAPSKNPSYSIELEQAQAFKASLRSALMPDQAWFVERAYIDQNSSDVDQSSRWVAVNAK